MSLILDALRKSEAERRRGQAPDLFAPVAERIAPATKPRIAMWSIAAGVLLVVVGIVFWPGQTPPERISPAAETAADGTRDNPDASTAAITTAAPGTDIQPSASPAPVPAAITDRPNPPKPVASEARIDQSAPVNPPDEVPLAAIATTAPAEIDSAPPPPLVDDNAGNDNEPALPTLATLDSATRATLPPLQLSMHVWNQDAARRFAIIDGQRLGEGGKLAGAVVAEIRRDGVVLDIGGRQFLLPRP